MGAIRAIVVSVLILGPVAASERRPPRETPEPRDTGLSGEPFEGPSTNAAIGLGGSRSRFGRPFRRGPMRVIENPVELTLRWAESRLGAGVAGNVEDRALVLLAMLGAGYTDRGRPKENRYATCVRHGLIDLLRSRDDEGCLADRSQEGWLRAHAVATLALSEAHWMTRNPRYRVPVQAAVDFLERTSSDVDTLTATWAIFALKSAAYAGLRVDRERFAEATARLERQTPRTPAEQAAILAVRLLLSDPRDRASLDALVDAVASQPPVWRDGEVPPVDFWYFGTLAMFQAGGHPWRKWNEAMVNSILKRQRNAGNLTGTWAVDTTAEQAKLAMCLEVYYRYDRVFGVK